MSETCPCQSNLEYATCCAPYHAGETLAPDAVRLMRSRYSAFALGKADYIIATTHRENSAWRKNTVAWKGEILTFCRTTKFLGLEILADEPGEAAATVRFQVRLQQKAAPFRLLETSRFLKAGKRWLYHSGEPQLVAD